MNDRAEDHEHYYTDPSGGFDWPKCVKCGKPIGTDEAHNEMRLCCRTHTNEEHAPACMSVGAKMARADRELATNCTCPDPLSHADAHCPLHGLDAVLRTAPAPAEVVKAAGGLARQDDLTVDKVAPETRRDILDGFKADAPLIRLGNPFDGVELPGEVDMVNHPPHYTSHPSGVECIRITRCMTFDGGNAFKYVYRFADKNGRQDLDKAVWYLEDAIASRADRIWDLDRYDEGVEALDLVVEHETNPHRLEFFKAMRIGAKHRALEAVRGLIADL